MSTAAGNALEESISVVIPAYNASRFIKETIESVLRQTVKPLEVIVIDDGSRDDTGARVADFGDEVRYERKENGGISSARNAGIRLARGEWIAFLDHDDKWFPEKLRRQLDAAQSTGAPIIHTDFLDWNETTGETWRSEADRAKFSGDCYRAFFWSCPRSTASAFLIRRACFEAVGLFDETLPGGCGEDLDMWIRLARRFQFAFIEEQLVLHRLHASNTTLNEARMLEGYYWARRKALAADAQLRRKIGYPAARAHLAQVSLGAAYGYLDRGDARTARRYFLHSLQHGRMRALPLWASTYLSTETRTWLRDLVRGRRPTTDS